MVESPLLNAGYEFILGFIIGIAEYIKLTVCVLL